LPEARARASGSATTGREGALVSVGEGLDLSSTTGTKVRRQKAPPLVSVEPTGTKGSFSPGWCYEPRLGGGGGPPAPAPTPFSPGWELTRLVLPTETKGSHFSFFVFRFELIF
jgi:hypothetical protein